MTSSTLGSTPSFRGLDLTVRRRLNGLLNGDHAGLRLGPGSEPEELTRYQPGHDVRRIDWKVTARAREPHLWLTRAEHELDTWLLLDQTPSMAFGTTTQEKAELAVTITGAVGLLTAAPGNRLGVATLTSDGLTWSHPMAGRIAARRALQPAAAVPRDGVAATTLVQALTALARRHRRPGLRLIVSDLLGPSGEFERPFDWELPLRRLTARHDVVVVEVLDPRELELPTVGHLVLVDPESGRQRDVDTGDSHLRAAYARAAAEHRTATAAAIGTAGAGHLPLRTDRDWVGDLTHFVRARSRQPVRRGASRRNR